jgi:pyrroloquinoline quinone (PQQ) biosynthesis protein C
LKELAFQYHGYSAWFMRYLTGVIQQLEDGAHRAVLVRNLAEESGSVHDEDKPAIHAQGIDLEWIEGVPHPKLYERFLDACGMNSAYRASHALCDAVLVWRSQLLHTCTNAGPLVALGALGFGTELIVRFVYQQLLAGIKRFLPIDGRDRVFFDLHCGVDDQHGEALEQIALELVHSNADLQQVRHGAITALALREAFFDTMWRGAQIAPREEVRS